MDRLALQAVVSDWVPEEWTLAQVWLTALVVFANIVGSCAIFPNPDVPLSLLALFAIRTGRLATSQLPLLYLLAGRANAVTLLTGVQYQTVRFYHKVVAVAVTVESVAHTVAYFVWFFENGGWWRLRWTMHQSYLIWGTIGTMGSLIASVWYFRPLRHLSYELFLLTHILGAVAFLLGCYLHEMPNMWNWCYAALALWGLERALRLPGFFRARMGPWPRPVVRAEARVVNGAVLMSVPYEGEWKGGEHFHIALWGQEWWRCPWVWGQSHPMTVANCSAAGTGRVELIIKIHAGLTRTLASHIVRTGLEVVQLGVTLEGPYGERPWTEEWENVLLVGGGSGVTFPLSVLSEMLHSQRSPRTREVKFVWAMHHLSQTEWLGSALDDFQTRATWRGWKLSIELYVTRDALRTPQGSTSSLSMSSSTSSFVGAGKDTERVAAYAEVGEVAERGGVSVRYARPDAGKIVKEFVEENEGRTLVLACGPHSLGNDIRLAGIDCAQLGLGDVFVQVESFDC